MIDLERLTKPLTVLYVEDDLHVREQTACVFKQLFKYVHLASNGKEGLDLFLQHKENTNHYYDLVISDIKMPKLDGISLSKEILKINPKQKIIITSAYDDTKYFIDLINTGVSGFFQKPIDEDNLFGVLRNVCKSIHGENTYELSPTTIYNLTTDTLYLNEQVVDLSLNEKKILHLFCSNPNHYFSAVDIFNYIYYEDIEKEFSSDSIKSMIKRLRKKIPEGIIHTTNQNGYSLKSQATSF